MPIATEPLTAANVTADSIASGGRINLANGAFDTKTATFNLGLYPFQSTDFSMPNGVITTIAQYPPVIEAATSPARDRSSSLYKLSDRIFGRVLAIDKSHFEILLKSLESATLPTAANWDDDDDDDDDNPEFPITNSIATLTVHGPLFKRDSMFTRYFGLMTYQKLKRQLAGAMANEGVKGILLDVDSPGGEAAGMKELTDYIFSVRSQKPIYACSNDSMYSAAYAIGCTAERLYVSEDGGVGSVGCYMMHLDRSGMDEQFGLKYTYIFAGDKKVDGNPHEPLSKRAKATMQDEVDRIRDSFVTLVAKNRTVSVDAVKATEAGLYFAEQAIPLLADQVGSLEQCMADLMRRCGVEADVADDIDPEEAALAAAASAGAHAGTEITTGAIPAHKTETHGAWHPGNIDFLRAGQPADYYRQAFAYQKAGTDGTKQSDFEFAHHEISGTGIVGPANLTACWLVIGGYIDGWSALSSEDRQAVHTHCAGHLRDAGIDASYFLAKGGVVYNIDARGTDCGVASKIQQGIQSAFHSAIRTTLDTARKTPDIQTESDRLLLLHMHGEARHYGYKTETGAYATPAIRRSASKIAIPDASRHISMLVAPYGVASTDPGLGFREIYAPGCFAGGLDADPRALFNHDESRILGRKSAGTAEFRETAEGIRCEVDAPETTWANDLLVSMRRGDITQSSAAFWVLKAHWETRNGERYRIIEKALLREAAVQAFPAYETASASVPQAQQSQAHGTTEVTAIESTSSTTPQPASPSSPDYKAGNELAAARLRLLKLR